MSQRMYGSTTACSVNVASTSNIPHNQSQQQNSGNTLPNAPLYYVPQLPTDAFGQQIIQYGDSAFGQENAYPSKDISSPTTTFTRLPTYSYNALPPGQEFTSNVQYSAQPPSLASQNNSTVNPHSHNQQSQQFGVGQRATVISAPSQQIHSSPNHQFPNMMHPPPQTFQKRLPETYPMNFQANSVPSSAFSNSTAPIYQLPPSQKMHNIPHNNGNNGHNSRLFDSSADNYTASWVSSTSSIPADQKIPPDHNSRHNSPTGTFENWTSESKMGDQQNSSSSGQPLNQFQMPQQPPTHIYAGQSQHASSSSAQIPTQPIPYYNPGQQQFLQTMQGFYPQHPSYIAYPYILPNAIANYPGYGQHFFPAMSVPQPPYSHVLWPPTAPSYVDPPQDSRFHGTWLDLNTPLQQELEIQSAILPHVYDHNSRQMRGPMAGPGLLGSFTKASTRYTPRMQNGKFKGK